MTWGKIATITTAIIGLITVIGLGLKYEKSFAKAEDVELKFAAAQEAFESLSQRVDIKILVDNVKEAEVWMMRLEIKHKTRDYLKMPEPDGSIYRDLKKKHERLIIELLNSRNEE